MNCSLFNRSLQRKFYHLTDNRTKVLLYAYNASKFSARRFPPADIRNKFPTINNKPKFFNAFHSLDDIPEDKANFLINSMKTMMKFESIKKIKHSAINDMLDALPARGSGAKIIEVGCGHGADSRLISDLQGDAHVTAVDSSHRMITQALSYSVGYNKIDYQNASVGIMKNSHTCYFDACHADRLLTSSDRYQDLFAEVFALIKANGIISITDVDANSINILPNNNVTMKVTNKLIEGFVNKDMGSKLNSLFKQSGMLDVKVVHSVSEVKNFHQLAQIFDFNQAITSAVNSGEMTVLEGEIWLDDMRKASDIGDFSYTVSFYTVQGRVPQQDKIAS